MKLKLIRCSGYPVDYTQKDLKKSIGKSSNYYEKYEKEQAWVKSFPEEAFYKFFDNFDYLPKLIRKYGTIIVQNAEDSSADYYLKIYDNYIE